ncbi:MULTISPECIES: N-acetyl-gamma-glutamyl-phosphate reductase [unclassified Synechococcus]|uniref:N-acetyl-gamma-glutamyl-phosphate reductase n=1 Tax=unclassified Synechococcus TaxID=2626047 RepID=UPI0021A4FD1F|nr:MULTISPECIES: N-acetyl-gamma-glutamyl-phosphate reductase [unclassified Synechococcus]MCT0214448.1 N-acetyl-gamma-glutamyl-phosphate reductase [Synechococcus sp. CS-1326]MCT0233249.1 N-acetyl-gamma-glutamyl-phosphate reductase [Synechococcus sp. CS-1327]
MSRSSAAQRVAVIGATGYGGLQTLRLLQGHPHLQVSFLGGERSAGKRWSELTPFLPLQGDPLVEPLDPAAIATAADLVVLSLPSGLASTIVPDLLERGLRVVDLSADYRYRSLADWKRVYSTEAVLYPRQDERLCQEAVYGLPEWEEARIRQARLVAAPGCFPTAALLPLLPFLKQGLIEPAGIIIDAKTGCSGGGRAAKEHLLLAEASEAVSPYGVVGHRHTSEIEQAASAVAGHPIELQFTPHLMPMVRGLLATVYARLRDPGLTAEDCTTLLRAAYRNRPCLEVLPVGTYPSTKWVRQTNRALLSVQVDQRTGQLIVMSAIDNLIKGQAGQGIQSLNLMVGLPPDTGLPLLPFYP